MSNTNENTVVLVVDDEPVVKSLAETILIRKGFRVLSADSGEQALELANSVKYQIDILLTDMILPGLTGLELANKLKSAIPNLKVLIMSGYTPDELLREQTEIGPNLTFVNKPFSPKMLLHAINSLKS